MFRLPLVLFSVVVATTVGIAPAKPVEQDDPLIRQVVSSGGEDDLVLGAERHFSDFKLRFGKAYATPEEHDHRFGVFEANLRRAKLHQKLDPSAVHGITKFSDLTPEEFRRSFLGLKRHHVGYIFWQRVGNQRGFRLFTGPIGTGPGLPV